MANRSAYFKTQYSQHLALLETRFQWNSLLLFVLALIVFPHVASAFALDLTSHVLMAIVGSVSLMLLTGIAGQISLGHAGLLASGAFTAGILFREVGAPFWITFPTSGVVGAILGVIFGLPALRLKGLYLAISTLALHFVVVFFGAEYETRRGFSSGILVDPPTVGFHKLTDPVHWYYVLLLIDVVVVLFALNLLRSRVGRAWMAIRDREVAAEALGIAVHKYKLLAFIISSMLTTIAGCLFAYFNGFVGVEAFSLFLTIEYVAMIVIGGMGSVLGAILGAIFVVFFPHFVNSAVDILPLPKQFETYIFAVKYAGFGLIMILFLVLEPEGLVGIWRRVRDYFLLWPFKTKPMTGRG